MSGEPWMVVGWASLQDVSRERFFQHVLFPIDSEAHPNIQVLSEPLFIRCHHEFLRVVRIRVGRVQ